jgi:hypothetical protein
MLVSREADTQKSNLTDAWAAGSGIGSAPRKTWATGFLVRADKALPDRGLSTGERQSSAACGHSAATPYQRAKNEARWRLDDGRHSRTTAIRGAIKSDIIGLWSGEQFHAPGAQVS